MVLNLVTPGEFFKFFFFGELPSKVLQMKELQFRVKFWEGSTTWKKALRKDLLNNSYHW